MGTTVRRTPITTKIPAAPDYKFLNLASFGGIVETDNPFTAETNSASDALNVYVDEYNALTTRPRVASRFLLGNAINGTILKTFSIENTLYVKSKISDVVRMYKIDNLYSDNPTNTLLTNDTGVTLTEGEFSVIRYEGNDFILNDENILINDNGTLKDVKNWSGLPIPLTIERNIEGQKGVESGNKKSVFINKHRESFELDNLETDWVYEEIQNSNAQVYKNDYLVKVDDVAPDTLNPDDLTHETYNQHLFDDGTYIYMDITQSGTQYILREGTLHGKKSDVISHNIYFNFASYIAAANSKLVFVNYMFNGNNLVFLHKFDNAWYQNTETDVLPNNEKIWKCVMNYNGDTVIILSNSGLYYKLTFSISGSSIEINNATLLNVMDANTIGIDVVAGDNVYYFLTYCDDEDDNSYGNRIIKSNDLSTFYETFTSNLISYTTKIYTEKSPMIISADGSTLLYKRGVVLNTAYYTLIKYDGTSTDSTYFTVNNTYVIKALSYDGTFAVGYTTESNNSRLMFNGSFLENYKAFVEVPHDSTLGLTDTFWRIDKDKKYIQINQYTSFDIIYINPSEEPLLELVYTDEQDELPTLHLTKSLVFDNSFWYYSPNSNVVRWSKSYNPLEVSVTDYNNVGDNTNITNALIISENTLALFKKDKTYAVTPQTIADRYTYTFNEIVNDYGCVSTEGAVISPIKNIPLVVSTNEISALYSSKSVGAVNRYYTSITLNLNKKYNELKSIDEDTLTPETIKVINVKYWSLFIQSHNNFGAKILVYDDRTGQWFYWTLPFMVDYCWVNDGYFYFMSNYNKTIYTMLTTDIINYEINPDLKEYYDEGRQVIDWYWKTQILPFGTINYSKRLVNTTFIVADNDVDDAGDGYAINYKFTAWKKTPLVANATTVSNELLKLVQSITKRTVIPRYNFLRLELSNVKDDYYDNDLDNNKFRLIGLGFKYVLLGGLY